MRAPHLVFATAVALALVVFFFWFGLDDSGTREPTASQGKAPNERSGTRPSDLAGDPTAQSGMTRHEAPSIPRATERSSLDELTAKLGSFGEFWNEAELEDPTLLSGIELLPWIRKAIQESGASARELMQLLESLPERDRVRQLLVLGIPYASGADQETATWLGKLVDDEWKRSQSTHPINYDPVPLAAAHALVIMGAAETISNMQRSLTERWLEIVRRGEAASMHVDSYEAALTAILFTNGRGHFEADLIQGLIEWAQAPELASTVSKSLWGYLADDTSGEGGAAVIQAVRAGIPGAEMGLEQMRDSRFAGELAALAAENQDLAHSCARGLLRMGTRESVELTLALNADGRMPLGWLAGVGEVPEDMPGMIRLNAALGDDLGKTVPKNIEIVTTIAKSLGPLYTYLDTCTFPPARRDRLFHRLLSIQRDLPPRDSTRTDVIAAIARFANQEQLEQVQEIVQADPFLRQQQSAVGAIEEALTRKAATNAER